MIDVPAVRTELLRIVTSLEDNFHTRQDMLQEGMLYLWLKAQQCPGRALTWYLKAAKFHLQNLRKCGRSLDSFKRSRAQVSIPDHCDEWDNWRDSLEFDEGFLSAVVARDLFALLVDRLRPTEQIILRAMLEGLGISEIADALHVPRGFVERHRLQIAKQAAKLA